MALGRPCPSALPDLGALSRRQLAERRRLPRAPETDLYEFWRTYLVGSDGKLGIELMTQTSHYGELIGAEVAALALAPGQCVADLGSGTGAFPLHLARSRVPADLRVVEVDFVRDGFLRTRSRLDGLRGPDTEYVEANLDLSKGVSIPIASASVDAVLGGLFLSYVRRPTQVLREIRRILKPGGRLVLSSLRRDADVSRLYTQGIEELRASGRALELGTQQDVDVAARGYLNQAARLLDLEEVGRFRFFDLEEFEELVRRAGFSRVSGRRVFGDPPQAVLVSAERP